MKIQVKQLTDTALEALSEHQRRVLVLRFGLDGGKKRTLQEIADGYSLTRERIRQVQNAAVVNLGTDSRAEILHPVFSRLEEVLQDCGGSASEAIIGTSCQVSTEVEKRYLHLLLQSGQSFFFSSSTPDIACYWYLDKRHKDAVDLTLGRVHDEVVGRDGLLVDSVLEDVFKVASESCVEDLPSDRGDVMSLSLKVKQNPLGEWGLATHPEIALSSLSGYIRLVLREAGEPLHFREIADRVSKIRNRICHRGSCHNELVRRNDFVLVGRGLYALKDMGYRPGTIADIIVAGMKERGPMTQEEIVAYVSKERHVKEQSVVLALGKKEMFVCDDQRRYFMVA